MLFIRLIHRVCTGRPLMPPVSSGWIFSSRTVN
jgi:hypothetical protein